VSLPEIVVISTSPGLTSFHAKILDRDFSLYREYRRDMPATFLSAEASHSRIRSFIMSPGPRSETPTNVPCRVLHLYRKT
jgi:hypothetical protein